MSVLPAKQCKTDFSQSVISHNAPGVFDTPGLARIIDKSITISGGSGLWFTPGLCEPTAKDNVDLTRIGVDWCSTLLDRFSSLDIELREFDYWFICIMSH